MLKVSAYDYLNKEVIKSKDIAKIEFENGVPIAIEFENEWHFLDDGLKLITEDE